MREALANVRRGAGRLVLVEGEAGIGKSALLDAYAAEADGLGLRVLRALGDAAAIDVPFGVVRELLGPEVAGDRLGTLDGAAGLAAPVFERGAGGLEAAIACHGLYWVIANLAEERALALLIDDAHWLDPASRRFASYLSARLDSLPVALVLAVRSGEGRSPEDLDRAIVIRPSALSPDGSVTLVRGLLGPRADEELCHSCHRATGGNPFFLRELTRAIAGEGQRPSAEVAARVRAVGLDTVARSVLVRFARLGRDCETLANALAVLAGRSPLRVAAALAGLDHAAAATAADALRAAGLLEPAVALSFAHPLVREAVAAQMPVSRRAALHASAARLLADEGAPADEVAVHLLAAEPLGRPWVVEFLRRSAREALGRGAPETAVAYLRRALAEPPAPGERLDVLVEAGRAETRLPTTEFGSLHAALALAGDPSRRAEIALELGAALGAVMQTAAARELLAGIAADARRLEPALAERVEGMLLAIGLQDLAATASLRPIVDRQRARVERGEAVHPIILVSLAGAHAAAGGPAAVATGLLGRALADPRLLESAPVYGAACILLTYVDEPVQAGHAVDAALAEAQRIGSAQGFMTASVWRAMVDHALGDMAAAEDHARRARALAQELGSPVSGLPTLVRILLERDRAPEALELVSGIDARAPVARTWQDAALLGAHGRAEAALGVLEPGVEKLLEADRRMREAGWSLSVITSWVPGAVAALRRLGRGDHARALALRELEEARVFGTARRLGAALSTCGLTDRGEEGLAWLFDAVRVLQGSPARLEHARALVNLGAGLRERGRREAARAQLADGLDLAASCGATALARRAREQLRAAGARPRRDALTGVEALTPAELRTARMAADGLSNKQIAQALFVATKTVESQLSQAYAKLGVGGRPELAQALGERATGRS